MAVTVGRLRPDLMTGTHAAGARGRAFVAAFAWARPVGFVRFPLGGWPFGVVEPGLRLS
jgi:hypothetical protein